MKKIILTTILLSTMLIAAKAQNSISLSVTDIKEQSGKLYVAVFDSNTPFLSGKAIAGKIIEVTEPTVNVTFGNLEEGEYAITMFHDENGNGKLDLGEYGIPKEKYGFSNDVDPATLQRPPVFDECKFSVKGNIKVSVKLVSAIK